MVRDVEVHPALRAVALAPYLAVFYPLLALRRAASALRPDRLWRTWITDRLLLGGFLVPSDVSELAQAGVRAVVNVSVELYDPKGAMRLAGMRYLRVPCWDTRVPTIDDAHRGVRFIAREVADGRRVYVHCASGVGRSVTLAACYLATHEGLGVEDALAEIARRRPHVSMSEVQRRFVSEYVAWHRARAGR